MLLLLQIGITPMAQVIEEITRNPNDKTKVTLLFANLSPRDVCKHIHCRRYTYKLMCICIITDISV